MDKIKVNFIQLFNPENIQEPSPALNGLINFSAKRASLKYDLGIRLNKAVNSARKDFESMRRKLCEDNSRVKEIEFVSGKEIETMMKIVDAEEGIKTNADMLIAKIDGFEIDGEKNKVIGASYDIIDMDEFNKQFFELLTTEIELDCYPVKLSKLELEQDCSTLDFTNLAPFIENDL